MARAFWLSLLVGYLAGVFGAAIYLPRAMLAPSLSNLLLLTSFSAIFVIVVSWRAWRGPGNAIQAAPIGHDNLGSDLELEGTMRITIDDEPPIIPAGPMESPQNSPGNHPAPQPISTAITATSSTPTLIVVGERLVQLPQRRFMGYMLQAMLRDGEHDIQRQTLIAKGLAENSINEFDRATLAQVIEWLDDGADLRGAQSISIELRLSALRSRKSRKLIDRLLEAARGYEVGVNFFLAAASGASIPRIKSSQMGENAKCFLTCGDAAAIPAEQIGKRGYAGVMLTYADLEPFLELPLKDDPVCRAIGQLDEAGMDVIIGNIAEESELRGLFDYPCHFAAGSLFGDTMQISTANSEPMFNLARRHLDDMPNSQSEEELIPGGAEHRLMGQMGYGSTSALGQRA